MNRRFLSLAFCSFFFVGGCSDNSSQKEKPGEKTAGAAAITSAPSSQLHVEPDQFARRFNQRMEKLGKNFRIEETPKIKAGPRQDTFQSNPTHQITIIGTVDKKTGYVINVMLVARGNDEQGMEDIIAHAIGMTAGYKPEIEPVAMQKEIRSLIAAYTPQNDVSISKIHQGLKLTYGMQTDMGLSHFSVRVET